MSADPQMRRIRGALERAAACGVWRRAERLVTQPSQALGFIHAHVAGTMLGRRLVFSLDEVPILACDVTGCRLMAVGLHDGAGKAPRMRDLEDLEDDDGDGALARLHDLLAVHPSSEAAPARISVRAEPLANAAAPAHGGISAARLAEMLRLQPRAGEAAAPQDAFRQMLDLAGDRIVAAASLEDDLLYPMAGEDAGIDLLAEYLETLLPEQDEARDAPDRFLCLGNGGPHGVITARIGGETFHALSVAGAAAALLLAWQEMRRDTG